MKFLFSKDMKENYLTSQSGNFILVVSQPSASRDNSASKFRFSLHPELKADAFE